MLITQYGTPDLVDIVVFVAGAVVAFGALAAIAFGSAFATAEADHESNAIVASIVHVMATLGGVLVSHLVAVVALAVGVPAAVEFTAVGFQATTTYNGLLLFEQAAVRLFA
jgi:fucose permease